MLCAITLEARHDAVALEATAPLRRAGSKAFSKSRCTVGQQAPTIAHLRCWLGFDIAFELLVLSGFAQLRLVVFSVSDPVCDKDIMLRVWRGQSSQAFVNGEDETGRRVRHELRGVDII